MTKNTQRNIVRKLPAVDRLLSEQPLKDLMREVPRNIVVNAARQTLDGLRARILGGWTPASGDLSPAQIADQVRELALHINAPSLRRAINATGIVLHTGLGRAMLPDAARKALDAVASGHSNLEIDLETGARGSRNSHFNELLADLCGAEAAFAVNNNAAAVLLALNTLAAGKEVVVSRGQLVEIGGSFRLPDIMVRAGARLVEVGTTNRTRISDYEAAISDETALILCVHTSNFRIIGFTEEVSIKQLVELGGHLSVPVMHDVGSGSLVDMTQFGLRGEPLVQDSVQAGADVVTFSGDKLLGGPQAGLVVGRREIVDTMAANPLARALRIDKLTAAALEGTLKLYADPEMLAATIPTFKSITRPVEDIGRAARRLKRLLAKALPEEIRIEVVDGFSEVGGGSLPGERLPTKLVAVSSDRAGTASPMDLARAFRMAEPPIFGRVGEGRLLLDMRTVLDGEIPDIVRTARQILQD